MSQPLKTASDVRREFLEFFAARAHRVVPSSPVFPKDDPTLLFTNAGMNQFKDVFLGAGKRDYTRAADTQKCIRVSGKHNDLEEVGVDTYHHTFFEMLGNWSFGDYFKRDAIAWAWELLTGVWGLPKDRLWVTVFGGDEKDGLPADEEAARLWSEVTDIDPVRILRFGKKDNFWEMGDTGPCGPCTEIHIDRGPADADRMDGKNRAIGVNAGNERFMELWNLVFIQFARQDDGSLRNLPAQHVDTGMGFERVLSVLQGRHSNYDTDLFAPIFRKVEELTGKTYGGSDSRADIAFRVIADHIRALTAALSDGALPGNAGRGYVLRRLLRRAARFGRQELDCKEPFLHKIVPTVAEVLGDAFPEMQAQLSHVMHLIADEERAFAVTLDKGLLRFDALLAEISGAAVIPGEKAYDLYATYGFPRDLVELMARERGLLVSPEGWDQAEEEHRAASKGAGTGKWLLDPALIEGQPATQRLCYGAADSGLMAEARPILLHDDRILVLDRTPFYAESGGQVGDQGRIFAVGFEFRVKDTQKLGAVVLHIGELLAGSAGALPPKVRAEVDGARRLRIMANHTATHLLHYALKEVVGSHANQQGSLVAEDRLRFDFTHQKGLSAEEIERIELLVNAKIAADKSLQTTVEDLAAAKARGVTALFGEKYDDEVRVVTIDEDSMELCGGTHCRATGQIGAFAILAESAVQAGVRRIEAVTREAAVLRMQEQRRLLKAAAQALKAPEADLPARILQLQDQVKELKKGDASRAQADLSTLAKSLLAKAEVVHGVSIIAEVMEGLGAKELSALCDALRSFGQPVVGVFGAEADSKALLAAFATKDVAGARAHAGDAIKAMAPLVGGGGGGRPDFAQAGGKDPSGLAAAIAAGKAAISSKL